MIWTIILSFIANILNIVIGFFPEADGDFITFISSNTSTFSDFISQSNWIIPVADLMTIFFIVLSVEIILFTNKIIQWIIQNVSLGIFHPFE